MKDIWVLNVSENHLESMEGVSVLISLKELNAANNQIVSLSNLPKTLEILLLSGNRISELNLVRGG